VHARQYLTRQPRRRAWQPAADGRVGAVAGGAASSSQPAAGCQARGRRRRGRGGWGSCALEPACRRLSGSRTQARRARRQGGSEARTARRPAVRSIAPRQSIFAL